DDGGAPATGVTVDGTAVDASGQVTIGPFAASTLQVAGGTVVNLPLDVDVAGAYDLLVELVDGSGELYGRDTTPVMVGYDALTGEAFTGFDTEFGTGIRKAASFTATLDPRFPDDDGVGNPTQGQWRVVVTSGGTPVEGAAFHYQTGGDPADHDAWTGGGVTDANGTL